MAALTFFFCGTGSNSFDFANGNYFQGELVSTLAMNHAGHEFVDWVVVDGPGSGNLQEKEKWVKSGNYWNSTGVLKGKGWEENVQHAVQIALGKTSEGRNTFSKSERNMLAKHDVGVKTVPGRLWGTRNVKTDIGPRISPQELQAKKVEILGQQKTYTHFNCIGWSRGGVTCHMFANACAAHPDLAHIPVNIFACDPVPGAGQFDTHRIRLNTNVANYVGVYSADERSRGFSPVLPSRKNTTNSLILRMPGRHGTLVGNAATNGNSGVNTLFGPGMVTRDLAEKFLTRWGTEFKKPLGLSEVQVLQHYDSMVGNEESFQKMHGISYTVFTQWGDRAVGTGNGTWRNLSSISQLRQDPFFINAHHRGIFATRYSALYNHLFDGRAMNRDRLSLELFNLQSMYPKLGAKIQHAMQQ